MINGVKMLRNLYSKIILLLLVIKYKEKFFLQYRIINIAICIIIKMMIYNKILNMLLAKQREAINKVGFHKIIKINI